LLQPLLFKVFLLNPDPFLEAAYLFIDIFECGFEDIGDVLPLFLIIQLPRIIRLFGLSAVVRCCPILSVTVRYFPILYVRLGLDFFGGFGYTGSSGYSAVFDILRNGLDWR
jgi:hypothetical protein